jgi:phosphoribosylamine--glycine ligase
VPISVLDFPGLIEFAEANNVDLTVVGPEAPLIAGIVDEFEARGLRIFGPAREPAQLEGSKIFSKDLMVKYGIPTAQYEPFSDSYAASDYARSYFEQNPGKKLVVKADGEAAGKGVFVCSELSEALAAIEKTMVEHAFGSSGDRIIIEECLEGVEVSLMAFTDGDVIVPMLPVQDHKRVYDHDLGPNTGGMGCYAPVPFFTQDLIDRAHATILKPVVHAIRDTGLPYKGVLYAGLMIEPDGNIKVLEFNARFGDPETEVVLPLLDTDLADILIGVTDAHLDEVAVRWKQSVAVSVVMASSGYPGPFHSGVIIEGLEQVKHLSDVMVFHAGTAFNRDGDVVTNGGRVLAITGTGDDFSQARARAYAGIRATQFEGSHYRTDIGYQVLPPMQGG